MNVALSMDHTSQTVLHRIRSLGIVPVLRASSVNEALAVASAIAEGGVSILEITMTIPNALEVLRTLRRDRPDLLLGAGTVLDPETARHCILEGAAFIVSPSTNPGTIELCRRYSVPVLPGALTPTEVVAAWQAGADAIKLFPASAMGGASYLQALKGPLPQIELLPTGGVSLATAKGFLRAGALALGVGSDLVNLEAARSGDLLSITRTARAYLTLIAEHRQEQA